jgi:hypothetical protein
MIEWSRQNYRTVRITLKVLRSKGYGGIVSEAAGLDEDDARSAVSEVLSVWAAGIRAAYGYG